MGGGIGRYQGAYGLLIDALVSVRLVTARGEVVEASKTQNPDLFWAIRGSGSNFGIVTSATYQAHQLTDDGDIFVGYYSVPEGREFEYFQLIESLQPLESKVAGAMLFKHNSTSNKVCQKEAESSLLLELTSSRRMLKHNGSTRVAKRPPNKL